MFRRRLYLILGIALLALVGAACADGDTEASPSPVTTPETDVFEEDLSGTRVIVSGSVGDLHADRLFELTGDDIGGEGLLVFVPEGSEGIAAVNEDDDVRVTGMIEVYSETDHEVTLDEGDDTDAAEFEGRAVIVAEEIVVIEDPADDDRDASTTEGTPEATATATPSPTPTMTPTLEPTGTP